jgi:mannosyltransferase
MDVADVRTGRRPPQASVVPQPPDTPRHRRRRLIGAAIAAAVLVGVALRFWTTSDLWLDEALTVNIARLPLGDIAGALRHDGAPPLYYFLLHGWIQLFGEGDLAVRSLSAVLGVATLPVMWVAARRLGGRAVAWTAVVFLATSPFAIRYGTEARMYSLVTLLTLLGYLALVTVLESPTPWRLVGLAAVTGALLLTHYWAFYLGIATAGPLLFLARRGRKAHSARLALLAMAAGSLLFAPWVPTFLSQVRHTGTPWAEPATFQAMVNAISEFAGGVGDAGRGLAVLILVVAGLAVFGRPIDGRRIELDLRTQPRGRGLAFVIGATLIIAIAVGLVSGSGYAPRYAAVVFGLFILLIALGTTVFVDPRVRYGVVAVGVGLGLAAGVGNVTKQRTQAGDVAAAIRAQARPGDVVGYCPDQLGPGVSRLLPGTYVQLTYPRAESPAIVDWVDYAKRVKAADPIAFANLLDAKAGPGHGIFLVWSGVYRTHIGVCEQIVVRLSALRPATRVVEARPDKFFENAELHRFQPR